MASNVPVWQVDIPGLSRLVLNAGAYGLKQLALSGVDVHTIGCMLMVSELVPACPDFRKRLNSTREKQRREGRWFLKTIEIVTATTFLPDQFLKTRAGENVLALMTAIAPLVSEDTCSRVLSNLFDHAAISADHTPGLSQFSKLRDGLIDFTRQAGFREAVLHHHDFLTRLVGIDIDPYEAIPSVESLVQVIKLCHKIISTEDHCILQLKGLKGSGWIAAYTGQILGLPVCAVDRQGKQYPITNNYLKAKVFIEPFGDETKCEVLTVGNLSDLVQIRSLDITERKGWSINCTEVNYLLFRHPELHNPNIASVISDFVAIVSLTILHCEASGNTDLDKGETGLQPLLVFFLPQIQQYCLEILETLGFLIRRLENYLKDRDFWRFERQPTWHSMQRTNSESLRNGLSRYLKECTDHKIRNHFYTDGIIDEYLLETVVESVMISIALAFSDWNLEMRSLSVHLFSRCSNVFIGRLDRFQSAEMDFLSRGQKAILFLSGVLHDIADIKYCFPDDCLVAEIDNVVFWKNHGFHTPIMKMQAHFNCLAYGQLYFEGQRRQKILTEGSTEFGHSIESESSLEVEKIVSNLHSRLLFRARGDTVWILNEIFNGEKKIGDARLRYYVPLQNIHVTTPCDCDYNAPFESNSFGGLGDYYDLRFGIFLTFRNPIVFSDVSDRKKIPNMHKLYVFATS
ncbi:MAG: hypothetical protein Q9167_005804 [Letrouitia subvulpina]